MLVGRAGVLEGGRVIVFGDGRLRRSVALVGLREIFCRPIRVGVVLDPFRQGVGVVYVGRGLEAVGVVPVELGEIPVEIHVAHYRVDLVTDPGEVVLPVPAEVRLALVVETVERMAQVEVMPVLVDLGGRKPVVLGYGRRDEVVDEALGAVTVIIVCVAQEGRRSLGLWAV